MTAIITNRRELKRTRDACEIAYPGRSYLLPTARRDQIAVCLAGVLDDGWQAPTLRRLRKIACGDAVC